MIINLFYFFVLFVKNDNLELLQRQRQIKNTENTENTQTRDIAKMDPAIEFISKFILCIIAAQMGKTFIAIKNIMTEIEQDDKNNLGRSVHIVFTMNTLLNNAQFAKRLETIEETYGKGSVCVFASKYKGAYTHVTKVRDLLGYCWDDGQECPRVVVMCGNKKRFTDGVEFIEKINKKSQNDNNFHIKRAFIYYDEIHEVINENLRCQIEEIHNLDIVKGITGFTATPFKTWTVDWTTPFWSAINTIKLGDYKYDDYVGYDDMDYHRIDDYFIEDPYVRPSPFSFDDLDMQTIGFIENVLTKNPQILGDNTRSFIPAHKRRTGHNAVRDLIFKLNNKAVVVILNGVDKTLEYNNCYGARITIEFKKEKLHNEEACETIKRVVKDNNLQNRPIVITGLLCVGMGQTLTHIETGSFTSAIFGHLDLTNDQIYQLFGRITGRMKNWGDKYVRTQVYCPTTIMNRCKVMEVCAMNIINEHNGDNVTQGDYMAPVKGMGTAGISVLENIRKEKKNKHMTPKVVDTDKAHKVFDTQPEAIEFGKTVLGCKFNIAGKDNDKCVAPKTLLQKDGLNPTVEYILNRWWGIDIETRARKCITIDNKWCVWWRPSLINKV